MIAAIVAALCFDMAASHGYLFEPPSRQRIAYESGMDYCPHCTLAAPMLAESSTEDLGSRPYPGQRAFAEPGTASSVDFVTDDGRTFGVCGVEKLGTNDYNIPGGNWGNPEEFLEYKREFTAGEVIDVSWCVNADHGGNYAWRLCDDENIVKKFWGDVPLTAAEQIEAEECFQRGILRCDDVADNSCGLEPRCAPDWGCAADPGKYFHCEGDFGGYSCANSNDNCYAGTLVKRRVKIPEDFPSGPTVLSWRWDSDETTEVFAACSDVTILQGSPAEPTVSPAPTPEKSPMPTLEPTPEEDDDSGTDGICCWWSPSSDMCSDCGSFSPPTNPCASSAQACDDCGGTWCGGDGPPDEEVPPSPTPAPERDSCVFEIVDGASGDSSKTCGGDVGVDDVAIAYPDFEVGGVRCCDDEGNADSFCESNCELTTYWTALERCTANNMRLCTKEELLADQAKGTGCSYNFVRVWANPGECDSTKYGYPIGDENHCCVAGECGSCFAPVFDEFYCGRSSEACQDCGGQFCYSA